MIISLIQRVTVAVLFLMAAGVSFAAETNNPDSTTNQMLLLDNMGRTVRESTNEVPAADQPATAQGFKHQFPAPRSGASLPPEIVERSRQNTNGFQLFSDTPPPLTSYLGSLNEYGNTSIRPGALLNFVPLESLVQGGKYWLSEYGFRYSLQQTYTFASLSGVKQGGNDLDFYTFQLKSTWNIYTAPESGTAGWISSEIDAKSDLGSAASPDTSSAKSNLGTLTNPTGIWSTKDGFRVPELAWQQSLRNGEINVVAGMISQRNYIDANAYADSGRSQFLNSALIHSGVLPLAQYDFGINLQWQPLDEWYAMIGGSIGDTPAGEAPWTGYNSDNWSIPMEFGYAPRNLFGLGPGVYRVQPFLARVPNATGGGISFDLQQQLGEQSPVGWFGRFGFGDADVSASASKQVGTGLVIQAPFKHLLLQKTSNDVLGSGFVWSQPADTTQTIYHKNEYVWETVYTMQLTPTIKIQPDFQMVWNPAFHADTSRATVFQIQIAFSW